MNIQLLAFGFGCLLMLTAILGGGFEVKELKVPKVGRASRLAACVFGMLFIFIGVKPVLPGSPAAAETPAAAPRTQPRVEGGAELADGQATLQERSGRMASQSAPVPQSGTSNTEKRRYAAAEEQPPRSLMHRVTGAVTGAVKGAVKGARR
jgi:hypothetical protein